MSRLSREHWLLLGLALTAFATSASGLQSWADVVHKPAILVGFALQFGTLLRAFFTDRPAPADTVPMPRPSTGDTRS